jgi:hypothetical protein|tara:strand:- start:214 stop:666 length:453 start_codon:yes stop_codon:yes gene_type:complete
MSLDQSKDSETEKISPSRALELVCLGLAIASKTWRNQVEARDWSDVEMQCIVSELKTGGGGGKSKNYHYLEKWLLQVLSVGWKHPELPADVLASKLKRNGCKGRVIDQLIRISEMGKFGLDMDLDKFFTAVSRAYEEAMPELDKLLKEKT